MEIQTPFPQSKMGKWRVCTSREFILYLGGWRFAVPFYSVQDCSYQELAGGIKTNQKKGEVFLMNIKVNYLYRFVVIACYKNDIF